jgi:hypothetical protein
MKPSKKTGEEHFYIGQDQLNMKLIDFWRWGQSDILSNSLRGVLAEYIVASALGIDAGVRTEWDAYDLITESGLKIEVKSSAYIQSWHQKCDSIISFDIRKTKGWDSQTNEYSSEFKRQADIYVFCLLKHRDRETIDPLNLEQWEFYILETKILNEKKADQQTICLNPLLKLEPIITDYKGLRKAIQEISKV